MKKSIFALFTAFILSIVSVNAWHCIDSDEANPGYGSWGDDGLLGGITEGWLKRHNFNGDIPEGCTRTNDQNNPIVCQDLCMELSLREFYCDERPNHEGETIIKFHDYDSDSEESLVCQPRNDVPEFTTVGAGLVLAGAGLYMYRKRKQ